MKFTSHRVGEWLFEIDEKINKKGNGTYSRQIKAVTACEGDSREPDVSHEKQTSQEENSREG